MAHDWQQTFTGANGTDINSLTPDVGTGPWISTLGAGNVTGAHRIYNDGAGNVGLYSAANFAASVLTQAQTQLNQRVVGTVKLIDKTGPPFGAALRANGGASSVGNFHGIVYNPSTDAWDLYLGVANHIVSGVADLVGPLSAGQTYTIEYRSMGPSGGPQTLQAYIGGVLRFTYNLPSNCYQSTAGFSGVVGFGGNNNPGTTGHLWISAYAEPVPTTPTGYTITGPSRAAPGVPTLNIPQYQGGLQVLAVNLTPSGATPASTITLTPSDGGAGGTFSPSAPTIAPGAVAAFCTYRPPASAAEGQAITLSFANNASLTATATKPITVTNNLLVVAGNSISSVQNGDAGSWPYLVASTGGVYAPAVANCSFSGNETVTLDNLFSGTYDALLTAGMGPNVNPVIVLFEGSNDLAHNAGYTATDLYNHYATFVANRRATWPARTKIVVVAWPDWTSWTTTQLGISDAAAALIRSNMPPLVEWIVDMAADGIIMSAGYTADTAHPSPTGAAYYAGAIGSACRSLHDSFAAGYRGTGGRSATYFEA